MKRLTLLFLCLSSLLFAKNDKKYSEEELNKEVEIRLEKKLKKLGRGKMINFSKELLKKEEKLKLRFLEVEKKEEQLQISSKSLVEKYKEFQVKQTKFLACLDEDKKKLENRVSHMVEVIGGMRPKNAAAMLSVQKSDISVKILGLLPSEKVSKIFNLMDKEVSARLQKQYLTMKK